jgi:type IV pilus assembly protein PilN
MVIGSIVVGALLAIMLVVLVSLSISERQRTAESRAALARVEAQMRTLTAEQNRLEGTVRRVDNAEVLDQSVFLNSLLLRKGISWTRIFADLETVFPPDVRLAQIRPQMNGPNDLILDMLVASQSREAVIGLLMKLEASPKFGTTTPLSWTPPSQTEPLYRYRITVAYAQKL